VRRNSDALSKEAAHLSAASSPAPDEAAIREQLSKGDNADLRFHLAELEEKSGRSLAAVNDYQRAAQLDPTEAHLFAWGAELLVHRAFDPSIEVFSKGKRLYPDSVRMILGLGAATYAKGSTGQANEIFLEACDVAPSDPTPYLFLGRVQVTETELPAGWTDRLKRFVDLDPQNAQAHYIYAIALTKKPSGPGQLAIATSHLKIAVDQDARFGDAYLELGILASEQGDLLQAVAYFQKAVENTALPDDAHYRLAQVYRRLGETGKAQQETELYKQASGKKNQQVEQERHELQQFVYTLREQGAAAPMQAPPK
jgi:tetratricopeptide (TPR) repeat protein